MPLGVSIDKGGRGGGGRWGSLMFSLQKIPRFPHNSKIPSINYVGKHVAKIFSGNWGGGDKIYFGPVKKISANSGGGGVFV